MQQQMSGLLTVVHIKHANRNLSSMSRSKYLDSDLTQAITLFLNTFCQKFWQSVILDLFYDNISGISPPIFT